MGTPIPSTVGRCPFQALAVFLALLYGALRCFGVEGAASEALLGGAYVPTTDVGFIEDLTELIEAIATQPDATLGRQYYEKYTPDSTFSLQSIGSDENAILNPSNPLYALYMYGYYRSANGNGYTADAEGDKMFLSQPVQYYGHTIISDEFTKASGYDSNLNADTIRVTNMWMATVQSLYDASSLCHVGPGEMDALTYINPVDKAAAFWYGTAEDATSTEGGSLYAWMKRSNSLFVKGSGYNPTLAVQEGLKFLQSYLADCLEVWVAEVTDQQEYDMDKKVSEIISAMTVPLVRNLIYYANQVAGTQGEKDATTVDYLILYALATLPPLRTCDKTAFDTLYNNFVTNAATLDATGLTESLTILFNNFPCLEVTCVHVGIPDDVIVTMVVDLPTCVDPPLDIAVAGYEGTYARMRESAVVDLDVLTIGSLVEMEANEAARNVYWWNKYGLSLSQTMDDVSLSDMAQADSHEKNTIGESYDSEFDIDELILSVIMATDDFSSASSMERREVVQVLLVAIVLPLYALDSMFRAIDNCNSNQNTQDTSEWDKAVASLIGFTEGTDAGGSEKGLLFYNIGQMLCNSADSCGASNIGEVNELLFTAFNEGKDQLLSGDCAAAEDYIYQIQLYMEILLIDVVAFYAKGIKNSANGFNLANGYAFATALYPLMRDDSEPETVLKNSLGTFGSADPGYIDSVMEALETYVTGHNAIDGTLFYNLAIDKTATVTTSTGVTFATPIFTSSPAGGTYYPTYSPSITAPPHIKTSVDSSNPPFDYGYQYEDGFETTSTITYYPTYAPSVQAPIASSVLDGGVVAISDGDISSPLYSGAYIPTSNVDHVIELVGLLDEIQKPGTSKEAALSMYTKEIEVGFSLQSLSTASSWNSYLTNLNPLQLIYEYGLWISGDGDNDSNGYSNKKFDDGDIAAYANSIVMDGFNKNSGFDEKLTAETIRVTNVWMSMVSELYKAVESCRDGSASNTEPGFNPVDHAAAFWFGSTQDSDGIEGGSLYAWAARAGSSFTNQNTGVNDEMIEALNDLQSEFAECKGLETLDAIDAANSMSKDVLYITQIMTVPLVQNFINDLASKAGKAASERDYLILYALALLPQLSICDEDVLNTLFNDLVTNNASFDGTKFGSTLKLLQDRYDCMGIHCSLVGTSTSSDSSWPVCVDTTDPNYIPNIAGYSTFSKSATEYSKIDLDVSTILSFIVMEANNAAIDIYKNGKNVVGTDGSYVSLSSLKIPTHPTVSEFYSKQSDHATNYLDLSESAIQGAGNFISTTPLQNSAAASLALVFMDLHLAILENMYQAVKSCTDENDPLVGRELIGRAAALTVGWAEGQAESGSDTDGYLYFQIAQEVCEHFSTCDESGNAMINKNLIASFNNGDGIISNQMPCDKVEEEVGIIENYLQAIMIDKLALHVDSVDQDERQYTLAHVSAYALLPFMRAIDEVSAAADDVEQNLGTFPPDSLRPVRKETVFSALKTYIDAKGIDCSLLSSSICEGISTSVEVSVTGPDADGVAGPNDSGLTLANGEYTPFTDVSSLSDLPTVMGKLCNADDRASAKSVYTSDATLGFTLESIFVAAKYVMADEILFNQYVYSFIDSVDKTNGKPLFDGMPAVDYAATIISDAIDENVALGCLSVKVLSMWMWVVHKLNDSIEECKVGDSSEYGSIDNAAAFWIGGVNGEGLLYELAEQLGEKFSHTETDYMTTLNREIISRLNLAQTTYFVNSGRCTTDGNALTGLRKLVKEITSYMTAVLIQGFIHSMLEENTKKEAFVELYAFAILPHISRCGHEDLKDSLYEDLVVGEFNQEMIPSIIGALHDQLNCLGLKCEDIGRHINADETYPVCQDNFDMLGYFPNNATKTLLTARLDLDAVAIHQLMSLEKYNAAKDVYVNGLNYYDYDDETKFGFVSLQQMTQSETIGETDFYTYKLFSDYLRPDSAHFIDDFIISAFEKASKLERANAKQRELAVTTAIKSFVSYMSALEALNLAASSCVSNKERAINAWDGGAALLIGSVEGKQDDTDILNRTSDGRMFFSISDNLCDYFDTCTQDGSTVTDDLLALLKKGQGHIKDSACSDVTDVLKSLVKTCTISLIQNAIYYAESSNDDNMAAGYIAGMTVLPWIDEIDAEAAKVIKKDMRIRPFATDGEGSAVLDAFKAFLSNPLSNIDCNAVSNAIDLCGAVELPASVNLDEPSVLSNGLYTATNFVSDRSAISSDIQDIETSIKNDMVDDATEIYKNGMNSPIYSAIGQLTGKRSLSEFSTDAPKLMLKNPVYNRFLFGLSDRNQEFRGRPVSIYADTMVLDLLHSNDRQQQLAAPNAMVVLNIWMEVVDKVYSAHSACRFGEGDPSLLIDEAAAYWIGDSQDTGSSTQGHLLYALTEFVGQKFEKIPQGSQSDINTRVLDLLNQAKSLMTLTSNCSTSSTAHLKLRSLVDELIPLLSVPLLRGLFYYLSVRDAVQIKMYALSVLPFFSTCSESIFMELKGDLIDGDATGINNEYVFKQIRSMYDCLGLSCSLVGSMDLNHFTRCDDTATKDEIAGFSFVGTRDSVLEHSFVDVDIRNIESFLVNGLNIFPTKVEDLFELAYEFYQYEEYSSSTTSMKALAKSAGRELVPSYASFKRYFDDDVDYADTIITNAFKKEDIFTSATTEDRRKVISFGMRYMVTYMAVLEQLYTALDLCRDSQKTDAHTALEAAAAYFIGSSEGEEDGGSYDGTLLYMLANRMCVHFDTCSSSNNAEVNEKIVSLFYAAQGEIDVGACDSLVKTIKGIESALTIPLIQGTLFAALENDLFISKVVVAVDLLPEGYMLAQSILPLIHDVDPSAAFDIADVMVTGYPRTQNLNKAANHGKVFRAMQVAIPKMKGLDCTMVGSIAGVSFCPGAAIATDSSARHATARYSLLLSLTAVFLLVV